MLADIARGHIEAAEILFLIAAILFGIAALFSARNGTVHQNVPGAAVFVAAGLCLVSIGWLIL